MKQFTNLRVRFRCIVTDKNGKIVRKTRWKISRSFTSTFLSQLQGCFATNGTAFPYVAAGAGVDTFGIQVGTGTTPPALGDTTLTTKITSGNGVGQLAYGAQSVGAIIQATPLVDLQLTRTFTNNTTLTITPKEIGLMGTISASYYGLFIHDLINAGAGIAVLTTQTLTTQYQLETSL